MSLFQYIGEGHTLVRTLKSSAEKVKIVQGEAVEIEEGLYTDGRLVMAGFQKIVEWIGDMLEGTADIIEDVIGGDEQEEEEKVDGSEGTDIGAESNTKAPSVEVTTQDDWKDEITLKVTAKPDRAAIMAELTAIGVEFKPVGESTASLVEKLAQAKSQ